MEQLKSVITSFLLLLFLRLRLLDALLSLPDALPLPRPMRRVTSSLANETARSYACTSAVSSQISSSAVVELPSSSNFASTYTNYTAINSMLRCSAQPYLANVSVCSNANPLHYYMLRVSRKADKWH